MVSRWVSQIAISLTLRGPCKQNEMPQGPLFLQGSFGEVEDADFQLVLIAQAGLDKRSQVVKAEDWYGVFLHRVRAFSRQGYVAAGVIGAHAPVTLPPKKD